MIINMTTAHVMAVIYRFAENLVNCVARAEKFDTASEFRSFFRQVPTDDRWWVVEYTRRAVIFYRGLKANRRRK